MAVLINNQQAKYPIAIKTVRKRARVILNALGSPDAELSVVLVDDARIAVLNKIYLQHQGPTNVISFPMREGDHSEINPKLLGDVVISMDTCAREGRQAGLTIEQRFYQLLVHGILHLFGYDHIHNKLEMHRMEAKSQELLTLLDSKT